MDSTLERQTQVSYANLRQPTWISLPGPALPGSVGNSIGLGFVLLPNLDRLRLHDLLGGD